MVTTKVTTARDAATVLAGLGSARTPWLTLALAGPADHGRLAATATAGDVTVVNITDPQAVPVMVNPFEPASGYPVQAHVDRLAGLFEAAFGLSEPVAGAPRAGLRRAYADCGWDTRTGMGVSPPLRLRHAARMMGAAGHGGQPGWLEVVLSWPGRLIGPVPQSPEGPAAPGPDVRSTVTG